MSSEEEHVPDIGSVGLPLTVTHRLELPPVSRSR